MTLPVIAAQTEPKLSVVPDILDRASVGPSERFLPTRLAAENVPSDEYRRDLPQNGAGGAGDALG